MGKTVGVLGHMHGRVRVSGLCTAECACLACAQPSAMAECACLAYAWPSVRVSSVCKAECIAECSGICTARRFVRLGSDARPGGS